MGIVAYEPSQTFLCRGQSKIGHGKGIHLTLVIPWLSHLDLGIVPSKLFLTPSNLLKWKSIAPEKIP